MVQMIRSIQPTGPYRIAGWSFGGLLAYEIATQLIGADQGVEFLGLIDTYYLPGISDLPQTPTVAFDDKEELLRCIEYATNGDEELQATIGAVRLISAKMAFEDLVHQCQQLSLMPERFIGFTCAQIRRWIVRLHAIGSARALYSAQRIPISVHLFAAQENPTINSTLGWKAVVPRDQLRMIQIVGTHHSMMRKPNVEVLGQTLSRAIRGATADSTKFPEQSHSSLFRLQSGRNKTETPIFCIPGAGDNVTSFIQLATCLDNPGPIYGLQPRGLDGLLVPHSTVSAASEFYLRAIEEIHPKGPIHLLGHSFGGWVAFDMAQQLLDKGRHVATLVILDSNAPDNRLSLIREYSRTEAMMKLIDTYEEIVGHRLDIRKSDLDSRDEAAQIALLHSRLVREGLLPRRSQPNLLRGPLRTFAMALRTHYTPDRPYQGRVQLVLADDEKLDQDENRRNREQITRGWRRLAPNLTYVYASGNHMTMLKLPYLNGLVHQLRFE